MADTCIEAPGGGEEHEEEFVKRYGERIGAGQSAVIYARDGIVAKVYRTGQPRKQVFQEAFTLAVVGDNNIPAPRVYGVETFRNRTALLMDQVRGDTLMDIMLRDPAKMEECTDRVVELQAAMHKVQTTEFRPIKLVLYGTIMISPGLRQAEKDRLFALMAQLPDGYSICHGDFHHGNILLENGVYRIIDWAEVAVGDPAADAARTYMDLILGGRGLEEMYLQKYCRATGRTREEILAWLPVMAGSMYGFLPEKARQVLRPLF
ncbi:MULTISPECIES: phosphotransferase family protein [unclassified Methanoregula]|uniref:phosphotransferase family protein n=1 Tax=unclassified Methanoregula TaxID=2649730 RepID=UPI0009C9B29B|nr:MULTISPECIES: aminoglycoside phosphotransferase family protein [unclassified Methanoregula]OPX62191.1 MAG: Phosphotransferase enzyme family protein [Methanoregula sp. PtaB.Bin085]OPY35600.1 MAG: Phosphotransferase enzyme family protein [Methanoregula sp. PtaU1.Bin006]